ncbi:hypothetical protein ACQ4PT_017520 [Festuca glaucescens]
MGWSFKLDGGAPPLDLSSLPSLPQPKPDMMSWTTRILASVFSALAGAGAYGACRYKNREVIEPWELDYGPHLYKYPELKYATRGFRERELLGCGGFGKVYRGVLPGTPPTVVAVKRVSHDSWQGLRVFVAEIASIGRLRHRNLVQLQGWCRRRTARAPNWLASGLPPHHAPRRRRGGGGRGYGMITLASTLLVQPSSPADGIEPSSLQVAFFYVSLYLIAIAQGADKPCGLAFAADQFDPDHPKERASRSSLFNWWFFSMAVGIYVAVVVVSYVQENVGWGIAFGSLCAIMLCTFTVFLVGTPTYRLYTPTSGAEIPFARLARSLATLARSSGFTKRHHRREEEDEDSAAKSEKAREVLQLVPIWAACLAYGMVYAQLMTLFNKQGRTMDRRVFGGLELPPAALQTIGAASVLTFVPVYDHLLVQALRYATGNPSGLTLLQRVGTGMAVSLAAVSFAALVEARRLEVV